MTASRKSKKKPAPRKGAGRRKPASADEAARLDIMIRAVRAHAIATVRAKDIPLSSDVASEIYWTLVRLRYGDPPVTRATDENLRAAALTRDMIFFCDCPQEQAVAAVFPNPNRKDIESLARNYRKLLRKIGAPGTGPYANLAVMRRAYLTTEHAKRRTACHSGPLDE